MSHRVLVVDDSVTVRMQVGGALRKAGFRVAEAEDGQQAWHSLAEGDISLVLCDVNMPVMNGLEFLEKKADTPSMVEVPVVMLTTEGQPEIIQRARALGAKGWLFKPFKVEFVLATVRKTLGTT